MQTQEPGPSSAVPVAACLPRAPGPAAPACSPADWSVPAPELQWQGWSPPKGSPTGQRLVLPGPRIHCCPIITQASHLKVT